MTSKQLRSSILQAAIQGQLVPQEPSDTPAALLLERIQAERERLIEERKIRRDKNSSVIYRTDEGSYYERILASGEETCIDDEIPFDIPDSWQWTRLRDVVFTLGGYAFPSETIKGTVNGLRVVRISDFNSDGWVSKDIVRYTGSKDLTQFRIQIGDLLLAMTGGTVGKSLLVKDLPEEMLLNQRVTILRPLKLRPKYLNIYIKSSLISNLIADIKNSTNDNISMRDINSFLIPIPPLEEQERIVARIEELVRYTDRLKSFTTPD